MREFTNKERKEWNKYVRSRREDLKSAKVALGLITIPLLLLAGWIATSTQDSFMLKIAGGFMLLALICALISASIRVPDHNHNNSNHQNFNH